MKKYEKNFTAKDYIKFPRGLLYDKRMAKIDFENVMMNLINYIDRYGVNKGNVMMEYTTSNVTGFKNPYVSYIGYLRHIFYKYFAIEINDVDIDELSLVLQDRIFRNGKGLLDVGSVFLSTTLIKYYSH